MVEEVKIWTEMDSTSYQAVKVYKYLDYLHINIQLLAVQGYEEMLALFLSLYLSFSHGGQFLYWNVDDPAGQPSI